MPDQASRAFDARVRGIVQGVGFRYSAFREAQGLGVTGWVRNEEDGSVTVHAEGRPEDLDSFAAWLREGPPGARVVECALTSAAATGYYPGFSVEY